MAGRPTDWHVLDLDRDPVPGDPFEVKELARKLGDFADDVSGALRSVRGLNGDTVVQEWAGLSGDAYREQFGDLPGELDKLERSHRLASGALDDYWPVLETAQADADRALAHGRTARQELDTATSQLTNADAWVKRAQDKFKTYQDDPKPNVPPPSVEEVRAATRNVTDANSARSTASSAVHSAQQKLDAAKQLAADAAQLRDTAASTAQHALHEASDAGMKNKHWWEKAVDFVADHWDTIISICKVIVAVLGIVVLIIGGPLAWLVLAAAILVLADTVTKYLKGQASLWDVLFAALDCIPMFKGLTTAGGLLKMARELPTLLKSGKALENIANSIRKGAGAIRESSRAVKSLVTRGDPIDITTGEMVLPTADVELPGILPLILERCHRSAYRAGRWFGPSWASTLDQRLIADDQGVRFTTADGMVLHYPIPEPDCPVMPVEGPRWPLSWNGTPGGTMTVIRPESGHTLRFSPRGNLAELPLSAITDRNDNAISVEYDDADIPREVIHSGGYRIGVETVDGAVSAMRLLSDPLQPVIVQYAYDDSGNLAEVINSSDLPLKFDYDSHHRVIRWVDRHDTSYEYTYDELGRCVSQSGTEDRLRHDFDYDGTDPATGLRVTTCTDSLGHSTGYVVNDALQVVAETDANGSVTRSDWDRYDRLISRTDPLGRTTVYTYDGIGCRTSVTFPDGSAATATFTELGLPESVVGPDGALWQQGYDERGNRTTVTDPEGAITRYSYGRDGSVVSMTDALGHTTRLRCDATGLPVEKTDPLGAVTRFERDAFGRITAVVDPLGARTLLEWTVEGRLARQIDPDDATQSWTYDGEGNRLTHTDAIGGVTRYTYTDFDLLSERADPDGVRYAFDYDTAAQLTCVTNSQGLQWRYTYDPAGRLVSETDFDGRLLHYTYDDAGQLTSRTTALGEAIRYDYDALGKMVSKVVGEGGAADGRVTSYAYDASGRLAEAVGSDATLAYERDRLGNVLSETCDGRTVLIAHDALGRRTRRETPVGAVSTWEYDAAGRRTSFTTADHTLEFEYDEAGRELTRRFSSDLTLTQSWDTVGRLAAQEFGGTASRTARRRAYTYRPDGYLTAVDDSLRGRSSFELDLRGRVTSVQAPNWTERYAYDEAGNQKSADWPEHLPGREAMGPRTYEGTRITRAGNVRYEHDAAGRITLRQKIRLSRRPDTWRYTWDAEDRLTSVITPDGQVWRYLYDPLGRRVAKQRYAPDGRTVLEQTNFTWDGATPAEQTTTALDLPNPVTLTWDHDGQRPLAQTERLTVADAPQQEVDRRFFAIVTDLVGTPSELVDESGEIAWTARNALWGPTTWAAESSANTPLRFPGQYFDAETGLHYNLHRYYDPETARYATPDPLGLAPAPNPRAYVHNPTAWTDPFGLSPCVSALRSAPDFVTGADGVSRDVRAMGRPDNEFVLSGHGGIKAGDGTPVVVPEGTSVAMYSDHGKPISDALGNRIETGSPMPLEVYGPGEHLPNYTLYPPTGLKILGTPRNLTVTQPTPLSDLLRPNMGNVHWAACRSVIP